MTPKELIERQGNRIPNIYKIALLEMQTACLEEIEIAKKGVPKKSQTEAVLDVLIQQIKEGRTIKNE